MDPGSLHDWVVTGGKAGLVRCVLRHQRVGGPGLIHLEAMVGGYTDLWEPGERMRKVGWVR